MSDFEPIHCPHCGPGNSMVEAYTDDYGYWKVGCGACGSHSGTLHPNHKPDARRLVIESWNRRPDVEDLRAQLALVLEDRARFPDRPDAIGSMINAHYGNLKAKAEAAEEHCRRLHLEKTVGISEARLSALEEAAKVADEAAAMRERLYQENGASLNASKAAQALVIAANIRALQSED